MVNLIIVYHKLGEGRYLRSLEIEEQREVFINHPLNLGFLEIENKNELKEDYERVKDFIKQENKIKLANKIDLLKL